MRRCNNRPGIHNLSAKIDTGAQGNTIPLRTFPRMYPDKLDAEGFPVEHIVAAAKIRTFDGIQRHVNCMSWHCEHSM